MVEMLIDGALSREISIPYVLNTKGLGLDMPLAANIVVKGRKAKEKIR
jgi:hypothetical protein